MSFLTLYILVYLNSLLATLNARWLFQKHTGSDHLSIPLTSIAMTHVSLNSQTAAADSQPVCPTYYFVAYVHPNNVDRCLGHKRTGG